MPPSAEPFFRGASVLAWEKDDWLVVAPAASHAFSSPAGTFTLYLPTATTLGVRHEGLADPGWAEVVFSGEFSRVDRPNEVRLARVRATDARLLAEVLTKRLGLPRVPRSVLPYQLVAQGPTALRRGEYIRVVGRQSPHPVHFEAADFSGCKLRGAEAHGARSPGASYLVTGFYEPPAGEGVVGYRGPSILVTELRPEPAGAPRPDEVSAHLAALAPPRAGLHAVFGAAHAFAHGRQQHLAFSGALDGARIVAALHGSGGQGTGDVAARVSQLALATLLGEAAYGPLLGPPVEPVPWCLGDLPAWVAWVLDRGPLPEEPEALLAALAQRIAAVLDAFNLRGAALFADGILAHVRGGCATLLRRGVARAYLARGAELDLVLHEQTLGRDAAALGVNVPEEHRWIPTSSFDLLRREGESPTLTVALQPGDRLLLVLGGELLRALDEPGAVASLLTVAPGAAAALPETAGMHERGWSVVVVEAC